MVRKSKTLYRRYPRAQFPQIHYQKNCSGVGKSPLQRMCAVDAATDLLGCKIFDYMFLDLEESIIERDMRVTDDERRKQWPVNFFIIELYSLQT